SLILDGLDRSRELLGAVGQDYQRVDIARGRKILNRRNLVRSRRRRLYDDFNVREGCFYFLGSRFRMVDDAGRPAMVGRGDGYRDGLFVLGKGRSGNQQRADGGGGDPFFTKHSFLP